MKTLNRHSWDKILEGLRMLIHIKNKELMKLPEEKVMQRRTLGQEILDTNKLIHEIKEKYIWQNK